MSGPVVTVPNLISALRIGLVPVFAWLLLGADEPLLAAGLLTLLGASDWVDGWIARRYHQVSDLGKVLDPTADRILLLTATVVLAVDSAVPAVVAALILVREAVISLAVLGLAAAGARRIDVQWAGKAGTLALMFALPGFLASEYLDTGSDLVLAAAWVFAIVGLTLSYYAAVTYIPHARRALREGRQSAAEVAA